jgi:hypothetical protein
MNRPLMPRSHALLAIAAGPPPEVLEEIGEAWERAQEAACDDLELHFESEPRLGRAWAALRRSDGVVIERLPAAVALAVCCGDADLWPVSAVPV